MEVLHTDHALDIAPVGTVAAVGLDIAAGTAEVEDTVDRWDILVEVM